MIILLSLHINLQLFEIPIQLFIASTENNIIVHNEKEKLYKCNAD